MTMNHVKPGSLKAFSPFDELPPEYVIVAASFATEVRFDDGGTILERESKDDHDYFLLKGRVVSEDIYGTAQTLEPLKKGTGKALPQLRPSAYKVTAAGPVTVIKIPQEIIKRVRLEAPDKDLSVHDDTTLDITQTREFYKDFKEELRMNRVRLPSLRQNAARVHKVVSNETVSNEELVKAISLDPSITAKMMKMANSSMFATHEQVRDVASMIERLGSHTAREIAACYSFRDTFKGMPPELEQRLADQVEASHQVGVIPAAIKWL